MAEACRAVSIAAAVAAATSSAVASRTVEPRTHWEKAENYHTVELLFDGNKIIYKDWWDPGHDPNRTEVSIADFLNGALHREIEKELGNSVPEEAVGTVELLTSGGPGVAEPPD